ncbi:MAG: hypothetical protein VB135_00175 [Burkholderia sp.]
MLEEVDNGKLAVQLLRKSNAALTYVSRYWESAPDEIALEAAAFTAALLGAVEWLVDTSTYDKYFAHGDFGTQCADNGTAVEAAAKELAVLFCGKRLDRLVSDDVLPEQAGSDLKRELANMGSTGHDALDSSLAKMLERVLSDLRLGSLDRTMSSLSDLVESHVNQASLSDSQSDPTVGGDPWAKLKRKLAKTGSAGHIPTDHVSPRGKAVLPRGKGAMKLRMWTQAVGVAVVAGLQWLRLQAAEIRGELQRATRPPVKVRWMEGNALGIQLSAQHGGGFVVVPMASGAMADVMSVESGRSGHSHTVNIFRQYSRSGQLLRDRAWSIDLKDASTARFVMASLVAAYTRGRSGSHALRNMMLGAVALVAIAAAVTATRPGQSASPVPEAQASAPDPMTAALAATSFNAEGGLPPELMAQILAGAQQAQAGTQNAGGVASDIEHESASMFQSRMHAGGPPQVPEEDVDMNSFGLGRTIAGCDPSLKFKVGAEQ